MRHPHGIGSRLLWPFAAVWLAGCNAAGGAGILGGLALPGAPQTTVQPPAPLPSGVAGNVVAKQDEEGNVIYVDAESLTLTVPLAAAVAAAGGRETTSLDTALQDVGRLLVGLFDYGNISGSVAPFGFAIEGGYKAVGVTTMSLDQGGAAPYFAFLAPTRLSVPSVLGMPASISLSGAATASAFFKATDTALGYMGLGTAKDIRRESRRYLVRDFIDGATLVSGVATSGGKAPSVSFRNLPLTTGQSGHRYLLFAIAYDKAPKAEDARILGYSELPVDPKLLGPDKLGQNVVLDPMTLVLDNDLLKSAVKVGVTVVKLPPTMEDGLELATPRPAGTGTPTPQPSGTFVPGPAGTPPPSPPPSPSPSPSLTLTPPPVQPSLGPSHTPFPVMTPLPSGAIVKI